MTPFALSILGFDPRSRRTASTTDVDALEELSREASREASAQRPSRSSRRLYSHYNTFQTSCQPDDASAPSYAQAIRSRPPQRDDVPDQLPAYSCTIDAKAKVLLRLESVNPLHESTESEWKEVFAVLRGTLLSFHRVRDNAPGKLLRSYTLQHAEIGLAPDMHYTILVPRTRIAHLVPVAARRKAWRRDPDLFEPVTQTIMRLRVETDQILLAHAEEGMIHNLVHAIGAGIDISTPIDERSIPRQCTAPRRRRRTRRDASAENLEDPALLAEQERILRDMYPAFAEQTTTSASDERPASPQTPLREEDELDFSVMAEQPDPADVSQTALDTTSSISPISPTRPSAIRTTTSATIDSVFSTDMLLATAPENFTPSGKWQPPHNRSAAQIQRYMRRCMPILYDDAPRASDILIYNGRRVKINWRMEVLEDWELQPPSYKAHKFDPRLSRSKSSSTTASTTSPASQSGDEINVVGSDGRENAQLTLTKFNSAATGKVAAVVTTTTTTTSSARKNRVTATSRALDANVQGIVYCF